MNPVAVESRPWSRARWMAMIALVFLVQLGLILALGERRPILPRPAIAPQQMLVSAGRTELLALADATLFALPHRRGFAAAVWVEPARLDYSVFRMPEGKLPKLELVPEKLGETFHQFAAASSMAAITLAVKPPADPTGIELPPTDNPAVTKSTLEITGDLSSRPLLAPATLNSIPAGDLVTNTVVQVLVDADGRVFSAIALQASPGGGVTTPEQIQADQLALQIARALRFSPSREQGGDRLLPAGILTSGKLIFRWHTAPLPVARPVPPN